MERLQRIFGASGMGQPPTDSPLLDSSEQVYISSLALLKMLKHGAWILPLFPVPSRCESADFVALRESRECPGGGARSV